MRARERADTLERAAREIVGFLRGDIDFEKVKRLLADTVVLYLTPEGGRTAVGLIGEERREPSRWVLVSDRGTYSFVPPRRLTKLTAKEGRHFNCHEYSLGSRFPELATVSHVGVKLEPDKLTSCLETWNATFIFDWSTGRPRVVAAVYDQWEW